MYSYSRKKAIYLVRIWMRQGSDSASQGHRQIRSSIKPTLSTNTLPYTTDSSHRARARQDGLARAHLRQDASTSEKISRLAIFAVPIFTAVHVVQTLPFPPTSRPAVPRLKAKLHIVRKSQRPVVIYGITVFFFCFIIPTHGTKNRSKTK